MDHRERAKAHWSKSKADNLKKRKPISEEKLLKKHKEWSRSSNIGVFADGGFEGTSIDDYEIDTLHARLNIVKIHLLALCRYLDQLGSTNESSLSDKFYGKLQKMGFSRLLIENLKMNKSQHLVGNNCQVLINELGSENGTHGLRLFLKDIVMTCDSGLEETTRNTLSTFLDAMASFQKVHSHICQIRSSWTEIDEFEENVRKYAEYATNCFIFGSENDLTAYFHVVVYVLPQKVRIWYKESGYGYGVFSTQAGERGHNTLSTMWISQTNQHCSDDSQGERYCSIRRLFHLMYYPAFKNLVRLKSTKYRRKLLKLKIERNEFPYSDVESQVYVQPAVAFPEVVIEETPTAVETTETSTRSTTVQYLPEEETPTAGESETRKSTRCTTRRSTTLQYLPEEETPTAAETRKSTRSTTRTSSTTATTRKSARPAKRRVRPSKK